MLPKIVVPAIAAIVGVGVGYGWAMRGSVGAPSAVETAKVACFEDATKKLMDAGIIMPEVEVRTLTGTVQAVSGNTLTLAVPSLTRNPLSEPTPATRTITVAAGATVTLRKERNMDEFMKEMDAYQKALFERSESEGNPEDADTASETQITAPLQYTESPLALADIKVGMRLTVSADANVMYATQIAATSISAIERPEGAMDSMPPGARPGENPEMGMPDDEPPTPPTTPRAVPPGGI